MEMEALAALKNAVNNLSEATFDKEMPKIIEILEELQRERKARGGKDYFPEIQYQGGGFPFWRGGIE